MKTKVMFVFKIILIYSDKIMLRKAPLALLAVSSHHVRFASLRLKANRIPDKDFLPVLF